MTTSIYTPSVNAVNKDGRPLLTNTCWKELRIKFIGAQPGPVNSPDLDPQFGTVIRQQHFQWNAANPEEMHFVDEMPSDWKAETNIYPHIHMAIPVAGAAGGLENVQWQVDHQIANEDSAFPAGATTINATIDVQDKAVRGTFEATFAAIDMTGFIESTMITGRVRRMVSIGNDYQNDVIGYHLDFYYEAEKMGTANRSAPYGY